MRVAELQDRIAALEAHNEQLQERLDQYDRNFAKKLREAADLKIEAARRLIVQTLGDLIDPDWAPKNEPTPLETREQILKSLDIRDHAWRLIELTRAKGHADAVEIPVLTHDGYYCVHVRPPKSNIGSM